MHFIKPLGETPNSLKTSVRVQACSL